MLFLAITMNRHLLTALLLLLSLARATAQYDKPYADSLKARLDSTRFDTVRIRCLIKLGVFYEGENPKVAEDYLLRAYRMKVPAGSAGEPAWRAVAAIYLGRVYNDLGDTAQAYGWCLTARDQASRTSDPVVLNEVWDYLSNFYLGRDRYDSALYYSQRLIDLWEARGMPEKAAAGYFAMGNIFDRLHQPQKAITYIRRSLQMAGIDERSNSPFLIPVFQSMGDLQAGLGRWDSVRYFAERLYPIALRETYYDGVIDALTLKAAALTHLGRHSAAGAAAREAWGLALANHHTGKMQLLAGALAVAHAHGGAHDSALYYARAAERYYRAGSSSKSDLAELYRMWADLYAAEGNWQQAHDFKNRELAAFTAFKSEELSAVTAQSEVAYETGKKEKVITELSAENRARRNIQWLTAGALLLALLAAGFALNSYRNKRTAARVLAQSNREKDIFLKEIHHRVKNNLQIISSLLYLQFRDEKDSTLLAKLKQAQERIKSMALVHNKLYEADDVVHVHLRDYLQDLASGVLAANVPAGKQVSLDVAADESLRLSLDASISLGLLLNEVLTNACKYAFRNAHEGRISVCLERSGNGFRLQVRDDGSGLPDGFDSRNTLGLRLVKNLAGQLGGSVSFDGRPGTTVTVLFNVETAA